MLQDRKVTISFSVELEIAKWIESLADEKNMTVSRVIAGILSDCYNYTHKIVPQD
jgi:hypothetical protein